MVWRTGGTFWHGQQALALLLLGVWIIVSPGDDPYAERERRSGRSVRFGVAEEPPRLVEQIKLAECKAFATKRGRQADAGSLVLWDGAEVLYGVFRDCQSLARGVSG